MKINEIKEVGFYREVNDIDRKIIYEVIENTDEDWLKEDPEATLLIDTWLYDYKDENDSVRYSVDGNLFSVHLDKSDIDVVKIDNTKYKVFGEIGQFLVEDKPTYKEQLKCKEQECEELKEENQKLKMQLCNNCGERDDYNIPCKMIRDLDCGLQKEIEENDRYRAALEEIKEIVKINCEEICGRKLEDCNDFLCPSKNIIDIINKAKEGKNDR